MSEQQQDYVTDAIDMLGNGYDAAIIEQPRKRLVLRDGIGEEWTVAWVKMSTAFKPHIKELRGSPLAVWLYICLSINEKGVAFPGIRTIAEDIGYSHQGVLDAIKILEEKGYLHVRRGERRYNLYEPEFAAIGRVNEPSETVKLVESSELSQVLEPNESTFSANESTPLDSNKKNKNNQTAGVLTSKEVQQVNDKVDAILAAELKPLSIREAMKSFPFNVKWDSKQAREFMEWVNADGITPQQITRAAEIWRSDKQFNWQVPSLTLVFQKWPALMQAVSDDDNKSSNSQRKEGVSSGYFA